MTKRLLKIFLFFLVLLSTIVGLLVYSTYVSVERVKVSYSIVKSESIGDQLNDVEIGYFSDIHFNGFMQEERLTKMIDEIEETHVDLMLFGGDIFDSSKGIPSEEVQQQAITQLSKIEAPLGKFAVLGSHDNSSEEMKNAVRRVLGESDFEILDNKSIYVRNGGDQSIGIIGVDSAVNGTPNLEQAFTGIKPTDYNIVLSHSPSLISEAGFQSASVNLFLSGNGFTNQVKLPVLGVTGDKVGHASYNSGTYNVGSTKLVISNGLGTLGTDMRFFLPPTFYVLRLQNAAEIIPDK